MKQLLFLALSVLITLQINANEDKNKVATTKLIVKDAVTNELLTGVAVKIDNSKETFYTDLNGEVTINAIKGLKYDVSLNYIGYHSETIRIEGGSEKIVINLKP